MASKRLFKKNLNKMIEDVVDECFSVQLYNPSKTEVTDKLIDEVVDFRNDMTAKIQAAKSKKDYPELIRQVEDAQDNFIQKLNNLQ